MNDTVLQRAKCGLGILVRVEGIFWSLKMRKWINILCDNTTLVGKVVDRSVYFVILTSLCLFALETLPGAREYKTWFAWRTM